MSAPLLQAGYRPICPGRSAVWAWHWPQVGQHPCNSGLPLIRPAAPAGPANSLDCTASARMLASHHGVAS